MNDKTKTILTDNLEKDIKEYMSKQVLGSGKNFTLNHVRALIRAYTKPMIIEYATLKTRYEELKTSYAKYIEQHG